MINCYKILEVPNFSNEMVVKRAYRSKAKQFHPDVNQTNQAQESFVIVTKAYQTLITPAAKKLHDDALQDAMLHENDEFIQKRYDRRSNSKAITELQRQQRAYSAAKKEIADFENRNKRFPYSYRIAGGGMLSLSALSIVYHNYFVDLNSNEIPMLILGYGLFVLGAVSILALVYKKLRVDLLLRRAKFSYDQFSFSLFFAILIIGPSSVLGLNNYRKSYHLSHYPSLATARIVETSEDGEVLFAFRPVGAKHVYMKRKTLEEDCIFNLKESWIIIRYSLADPRIVELVRQTD